MRNLFSALAAILLTSCAVTSALTPYKIEIRQGNYVTQDSVDKLKPGMSKSQVKFLLGTPLVADIFHADRWDYVYRLYRDGKLAEEKKFSVLFEGDQLKSFEGEVMPALRGAEKTENTPPANPSTDSSANDLPTPPPANNSDLQLDSGL